MPKMPRCKRCVEAVDFVYKALAIARYLIGWSTGLAMRTAQSGFCLG